MDKEVSIVLSRESRSHRKVAQEWYGLTSEQMVNMDVHHNPPRHEGGRNIPEHLYVYHYTLHSAVHGDDFTKWARKGGALGAEVTNSTIHREKNDKGKSVHAVNMGKRGAEALNAKKDEFGRSVNAVKGATQAHKEKDEYGRSINAVKGSEKLNAEKDEFGRSLASLRGAISLHSARWEDPDHPELGLKPPGVLSRMQRARGLPHGPENRRRAG
jgi:hypothetical protein